MNPAFFAIRAKFYNYFGDRDDLLTYCGTALSGDGRTRATRTARLRPRSARRRGAAGATSHEPHCESVRHASRGCLANAASTDVTTGRLCRFCHGRKSLEIGLCR